MAYKKIKISLALAVKLMRTKKSFFLFEADKNNKLIRYKLTNDLTRYRKEFNNKFRVVEIILQDFEGLDFHIKD